MTVEVDREDAVQARKNAWHQSTLETLLDGCSWQYYLTYQLAVPTPPKAAAAVGVAYHSALELHENERLNGNREGLPLGDLVSHAVAHVREVIDDDELAAAAKAAVTNWYSAPTRDEGISHRQWVMRYTPIAIEPYFRMPLVEDARPIAGWVDAVYRDDDTGDIFLADHKTAKSLSRWGKNGDEHRHQATLYSVALALDPAYPDVTGLVRMEYLVSRTSIGKGKSFEPARRVTVQPDMQDVALLGERIRKAEQIVANGEYARRPEWALCAPQWCPFYDKCMVTGELAGTPQAVALRLREVP